MARDTCLHSTRRPARRPARRPRLAWRLGAIAAMLLLAACASPTTTPTAAATVATSAPTSSASAGSGAVSLTALPLGDGHVGSRPQVGWVYACQTTFPPRGGAQGADPWIHGSTWDETAKIAVEGSVNWSQASYSMQVSGGQRVIVSNDLPVGYPTGSFPIQIADPAFQLDRNPNSVQPQAIHYSLPANPTLAPSPTCVGMGPIGVLTDGVLLFNALDAEGRDAQAHEVQDRCGGHPQMNGMYHYHGVSPCLMRTATGSSTLIGYALDGFGIYVERDANGALLTDADLDACHGRTSIVTWDGKQVSMYHYDATAEYPYTVGCFMGAPVRG
ncbi:MAG TPA: YHYH protein [Ktedonobacterales bacterium]|nr:YHYH protein [Ktedonobacterales bacterium]